MATLSSSSKPKIIWKWKSNPNPWANVEPDTWEQYSDSENHIIENAYQQHQDKVELSYFWIDFQQQSQIRKHDPNKRRPIKRDVVHIVDKGVRGQRFTMEKPQLDHRSLNMNDPFRCFVDNSGFILISDNEVTDALIEKAAYGIEVEGTKLGKQQQAQTIANELRGVKSKSTKEVLECCVELYTAETFLYRLINKVMREADMCKGMFVSAKDREYAQTLGPYISLLEKYLRDSPNQDDITVYRCATLTDEMVHDYKTHIGSLAWWDAFSSTTKNKVKALEFESNTLFIIHIPGRRLHCSGVDISSLSLIPNEEEILLQPGIRVSIEKVEYDPKINKHVINLEVSSCTCSVAKTSNGHKSYYS